MRPDRFRKLVARRCASARHDAGVSVGELAQRLRVHVNDIHRIEAAEQAPSAAYLAGLAEAADVSCDYLLGRADTPRPWAALPESSIPAALVRDAILLTHPDRHPTVRQAQATRVTQELNELLDRRG